MLLLKQHGKECISGRSQKGNWRAFRDAPKPLPSLPSQQSQHCSAGYLTPDRDWPTTVLLKSGCWTSRRRCMIDGSPGLFRRKGQTLTGTSPQTAGSLCCEASDCQEMSRGGCCRETSGCVCFDELCCVDADCLGAHMRKASASVWSCPAQSLWKQVPAAPAGNKIFMCKKLFKYSL